MSAGALLSDCSFDFLSARDRLSKDAVSSSGDRDASHRRSKCDQRKGSALFDGVPHGAYSAGNDIMSSAMFSPFANSFRQDSGAPVLGGVNSDGSSSSDLSAGVATSPVGGLSGYSPFMGVPWGNTVPAYLSEPPAGPLEMPSSPMSPGVTFNPSPSPSGLGAPGSPRSLFSSHSPNPYGALGGGGVNNMRSAGSLQMHGSFTNAHSASLAAADAAAAAAAAAALNQLPSFYYQAAAAAAGGAGAAAANNLSLQAALSQSLMSQHTANLAAVQQQQMQQHILQASLSAAFSQANNPYLQGYPSAVLSSALEPMRSAGGSLSLDGGLQHQASAAAAAAALLQHQQQQHHQHAAAQLRRNLSTPAAVAAQLQLSSAAAAASASLGLSHPLSASASALSPLTAQMGRLHVTHSADLSHLDAAALLGSGSMGQMAAARSQKFKARKNSEPKIGPDGQPRLNARQRRTLRRAKERALKGLLEVSQALLQKAEVQVTVPNISHLTALEELAAVEAEKEAAASEHAARHPDTSMSSDQAGKVGGKSAGGQTRSQQLAAAAAAVEESVCEIARAAVAAVTAQATGKDTSSAAAAAKAAAANAASAAASAGAVLPSNFVMPEHEEPSDELPGCEGMMDCCSNSAPTSPVGSSATAGEPSSSSGRSSSSSSSGGATSSRCSSSSGGSSSAVPSSGKPPIGSKAGPPPALVTASSLGSPLVSPSPSPTPAVAAGKGSMSSQLEGIDIAGLIGQLSLKKDEGMVDDKLIRDLQIIQSLIGALKAPSTSPGLESASSLTSPGMLPSCSDGRRGGANPRVSGGGVGGAKGSVAPKRANSYSPGSGLSLHPSLPH